MMVNIIIIAIIMVIDYDYYGMRIIIITRKEEANALYKKKIKVITLNTYVRQLDTYIWCKWENGVTHAFDGGSLGYIN